MTEHEIVSLMAAQILSGMLDHDGILRGDVPNAVAAAIEIRRTAAEQLQATGTVRRYEDEIRPSPQGATEEYARGWNAHVQLCAERATG